jgi:3-methyladenine DNA glycosylase AlkD
MSGMNELDQLFNKLADPSDIPAVTRILEEAFIRLAGDPEYLSGMKMVVPGVGSIYGVKVPLLRELSKVILRCYKGEKQALERIAEGCWFRKTREHQLVALFVLAKMKLTPKERWSLGERFLPEVNNWESCDQLCMALLGQALAEDPAYMEVIESWLKDENIAPGKVPSECGGRNGSANIGHGICPT